MYLYLLNIYQQWCSGLDNDEVLDGERFIKHVCRMIGYHEDQLRKFLVKQPWFKSKVDEELL